MNFKHIFYDDTKELKYLMRGLKVYNKRAYKQLIFKERFEELNFVNVEDDLYIAELLTDDLFKKIYGTCKVVVRIKNDQAKVIRVEPMEIFIAGYRKILPTYKGVPYRNDLDLLKIKLIGGVKNGTKKKNTRKTNR